MKTFEQFLKEAENKSQMVKCPKCLGRKKDANGNFCDYCGGSGKVTADKK